MNSATDPIAFRVRIGVTGHRNLEARKQDTGALASRISEAVRSRLEEIFAPDSRERFREAQLRNAPPIRYCVVSPLAEGADRLVAKTILQCEEEATLDAVLPLAHDDYVNDFATSESKAEFEELLGRCRSPHYLRRIALSCEYSDPGSLAEMRRVAYGSVGRFVVDHCDVLIALWDGQSGRPGGTADTVKYARSQGKPLIVIWDGDIQQIEGNMEAVAIVDAIDRYNHLPLTAEQIASKETEMKQRYLGKPAAAAVPEAAREILIEHLLPHSARASLMAEGNQESFLGAGRYVYLLSTLAVACVALAVLIESISPWGFGAELIVLLTLTLILERTRRQRHHNSWMDYRFLAERLRCASFMALSGVEPDDIAVPPFLAHSHRIGDWTVRTFDEIWNRLPRLAGCTREACLQMNPYIREAWIQGQINFHSRKDTREGTRRRRLDSGARVLLLATIAAAFAHTIWHWLPGATTSLRWMSQPLTFIAIVFPAATASLAGMQASREHLRLEKRSESMVRELKKLKAEMETATDPLHFEMLLRRSDELMLRENQEWLTLMRFVEIKG